MTVKCVREGTRRPRPADPDLDLVQQCQRDGSGQEAAFAELVARHRGWIRQRAVRMLGGEAEADDVVQDVFVNVHRFLHRFEPEQPFAHWISVVASNACRIELRRRAGRDRRHSAFASEPARGCVPPADLDPALRTRLLEALAALQPVTRDCILLRVVDQFTYREIGERLGMSVSAVKMRVARGLTRLRAELALEGVVPGTTPSSPPLAHRDSRAA